VGGVEDDAGVRALGIGVDITELRGVEAVCFVGSRSSQADIVQNIRRALRPNPGGGPEGQHGRLGQLPASGRHPPGAAFALRSSGIGGHLFPEKDRLHRARRRGLAYTLHLVV
jgi:hypothetical protein